MSKISRDESYKALKELPTNELNLKKEEIYLEKDQDKDDIVTCILTPRKLVSNAVHLFSMELTKESDLTKIKNFTIKVNSASASSYLKNVRYLWISHCNLKDIDGIHLLINLEELYVSYNDISELNPLCMMEKLKILDLEKNNITDIKELEYLLICTNLTKLNINYNPLTKNNVVNKNKENYKALKSLLPLVDFLNLHSVENLSKKFNYNQQTNSEDSDDLQIDRNFIKKLKISQKKKEKSKDNVLNNEILVGNISHALRKVKKKKNKEICSKFCEIKNEAQKLEINKVSHEKIKINRPVSNSILRNIRSAAKMSNLYKS
ncbi:hypothetical protein A3Q56_04821 [Intoshia linei]|uniref:Leucine-rich repeat protein n=1 Tax=Intoshia linei TaxID=1819745 RepID=A0A177AZQ2_9BILA|nr:hypothetical protein A3Q56_04821 [Intoshia linei]